MPAHRPARPWLPATLVLGAGLVVLVARAGAEEPASGEPTVRMLEAKLEALERRVSRLEQVNAAQAQLLMGNFGQRYVEAPPVREAPPVQADKFVPSSPDGEVHVRPVALPRALIEKYAGSVAECRTLVNDVSGKFIAAEGGIQFQVDTLAEASLLGDKLGIRVGDRLLSINGLPVTGNEREFQNVWERLKREKRWSLRLVRDGQMVVLNYYLGE